MSFVLSIALISTFSFFTTVDKFGLLTVVSIFVDGAINFISLLDCVSCIFTPAPSTLVNVLKFNFSKLATCSLL